MNGKQRTVLWILSICLILLFLFPPFLVDNRGAIANVGHHFFLFAPETDIRGAYPHVNSFLLAVQSAILISIGGLFYWLFGEGKKNSE